MEALSKNLASSEIKVRQAALEEAIARLRQPSPKGPFGSDCKNDVLVRFMSNCVSILKDANPKLVLSGLDCTQLLLDLHGESFAPLVNMAYELLLSKFGDTKAQIRARATEVLVTLLNMIGMAAGFEKLSQNLTHKNYRVKEHILYTVLLLHQSYGDEVVKQIPTLPTKVALLLTDQQASVRQMAVDTLASIHTVLGDTMLIDLEISGVRTSQIKQIQEAVRTGSYMQALAALGPLGGNTSPIVGAASKPESFGLSEAAPATGTTSTLSKTTKPFATVPPPRDRASASSGPASAVHAAGPSSFNQTMPAMSSGQLMAGAGAGASDGSAASMNMSMYHPTSFVGLLSEGATPKPSSLYSEKDLIDSFKKVVTGLMKTDDWQARTSALLALQGIACGDGMEFEAALLGQLRGINEVVIAQIGDLRSSVSKEACRTVAMLSRSMGGAFAPFAELWLPALIKQVVLKIQVMSSAADRSIRIILASNAAGFPKVMPIVLEQCSSKTPSLRKAALEYTCLCCAVWRTDVLERLLAPIKQSLRTMIADADAGARKTARHLFWVLRSRPSWQSSMDGFLQELDPTAQKHIYAEIQNPAPELLELLELLRNPVTVSELDPSTWASTSTPSQQKDAESTATTRPTSAARAHSALAPPPASAPASAPTRRPASATMSMPPAAPAFESDEQPDSAHAGRPRFPGSLGALGALGTSGASRRLSMGGAAMRMSKEKDSGSEGGQPGRSVANIVATERVLVTVTGPGSTMGSTASLTAVHVPFSLPAQPEIQVVDAAIPTAESYLNTQSQAQVQPQAQAPPRLLALSGKVGGAQRVVRPAPRSAVGAATEPETGAAPSSSSAAQAASNLGATTDSLAAGAGAEMRVVFTAEFLRNMAEDQYWGTRLRGFEAMHQRLRSGAAECAAGGAGVPTAMVELFLDLAVAHAGDAHQRVAGEVLALLGSVMELCPGHGASRLGSVLVALFHRLADRRQSVRDAANQLLNTVRVAYDPVMVVSALSPKIPEIPERMKAAVMQFLGVVVPHCGSYFMQPQHTSVFLGRMAAVLGGCAGTKPSMTLVVAGRRLLELVYNTASPVVLAQIAAMPLQQQTCIKRLLENAVPAIDTLVATAGRADWAKQQVQILQAPKATATTTSLASVSAAASRPAGASAVLPTKPVSSLSDAALEAFEIPIKQQTSPLTQVPLQLPAQPRSSPALFTTTTTTNSNSRTPPPLPCETAPLSSSSKRGQQSSPALAPVHVSVSLPWSGNSQGFDAPLQQAQVQSYSASRNGGAPTPPSVQPSSASSSSAATPPPARDLVWLLQSLRPSAPQAQRLDAMREAKALVRSADDTFWACNCAQVLSVLLEAFDAPVGGSARPEAGATPLTRDALTVRGVPLTGYTPPAGTPSLGAATSLRGDMAAESKGDLEGDGEAENRRGAENQNRRGSPDHLYLPTHSGDKQQQGVGSLVNGLQSTSTGSGFAALMPAPEAMHLACKVLMLLAKFRSQHVKNFMDLLTCRLCQAAAFAPVAVTLHSEQVLADLAPHDPVKLVRLLLPFAGTPPAPASGSKGMSPQDLQEYARTHPGASPNVRLLALHVLASTLRHLSSAQLLSELPGLVNSSLPSLSSSLVDLRKAVVFVLVEAYMVIGDALHPFVQELTPPQRKLFTIYIDRRKLQQ